MLWQILFVLSCFPVIVGVAIIMATSPKPHRTVEQLQGVGRFAVLVGSAFAPLEVFRGWQVPWSVAILALGLGLLVAIYARENHLLALAKERLADVGQESGT